MKRHDQYPWPDLNQANGSHDFTGPAKLLAVSIRVLGAVIIDAAQLIAERCGTSTNKQSDDASAKS